MNAIRWQSQMAKSRSRVNPDAVVAMVTEKQVVFGLVRMWMTLVDGVKWEIEMFRDLDTAKSWVRERVKDKYGIEGLTFESGGYSQTPPL